MFVKNRFDITETGKRVPHQINGFNSKGEVLYKGNGSEYAYKNYLVSTFGNYKYNHFGLF